MANHLNMTKGRPAGLMLRFALPLMLGSVLQQLYTVVDTAIVGQGVGLNALAALGTVDWLNWMFLGIAQGFSQGFSVRMSQKYGQGDIAGLKRTIGVSVRLSLWIALIAVVTSQLLLPMFLSVLRVPAALYDMALLYTRILMAGLPAIVFYNLCASILRAVGDSKTPLMAMAAASVTNIVLDCIAVFWLKLGVAGAAGATVIAQILAGGLCAVKIRKSPQLRFAREDMARDSAVTGALMGLGVPMAIQSIIISIGGMAVQSVVNQFNETSFIAGFTATNKLYGLLEIAAVSYGYAITTFTGQNFGAGLWDRIRKGNRQAVLISIATAVLIGAVMILLGREITMLFISREDPVLAAAAGETAYRYLFVMSISLPILYLLYAYRSALQGMGDAKIPLLSGVAELVMRVGVAMVIGRIGWQDGIYLAEVSAWLGAAVLQGIAYYYRVAKLGK